MVQSVEKLIDNLQEMLRVHRELVKVLDNKLDAMRCYDLSRLESLSNAEQRLVGGVAEVEKRRQEIIIECLKEVPVGKSGWQVRARDIARVVEEPQRSKLLVLVSQLRETDERLGRLNNVVDIAVKKFLGHFDYIFRVIAQAGKDIGLYSRAGKKAMLEQNRIIDAVV